MRARAAAARTSARHWLRSSLAAFALVAGVGSALAQAGVADVSTSRALGPDAARRLLTRAGFAPNEAEVAAYAGMTQRAAVERLLEGASTAPGTPAPAWVDDPIVTLRARRGMTEEERSAERAREVRRAVELRAWWLREMASTPSPLTERMTMFWHNHFVSAQPKVRWSQWMYRQNLTFRRHATGNFGALLHAAARDPAMLFYLDAAANRRGAPNENFARELMELFTLGEGRFSETDVKEAARAFTGWSIDPERGTHVFRRALHDGGSKTVLGRSGAWTGDDVLALLLAQPATSEYIVARLWREFVSPQPDPRRAGLLAARFRADNYELRPVLRELLNQPEVIAPDDEQVLVKSPVELVIGLARQSESGLLNPAGAAIAVAAMGQNLFAPPNVRGWVGGEAWINTQTLLARKQFLEQALAGNRGGAAATAATAATAESAASIAMTAMTAAVTADADAAQARRIDQSVQEPRPQDPQRALRQRMERAAATAVRVDGARWLKSLGGYAVERPLGEVEVRRLVRTVTLVPAAPEGQTMLALDALRGALLDPTYQLK